MARLDIKVRDRLGAVEFLEIDRSWTHVRVC